MCDEPLIIVDKRLIGGAALAIGHPAKRRMPDPEQSFKTG
jgi:hypothetical protein